MLDFILDPFLLLQPLLFVAFVIIITKGMLSVAKSVHNGLYLGTLPLCLNVKLKCLWSAHRETSWPCPPANGYRKEEMNTSPLDVGQARRYFARLMAFLLHLLTSSPSWFYKRKWHPDPDKMVLCGASPPSFWISGFLQRVTIPCLNTSSPSHRPVMRRAEWAWIQ